MTEQLDLFGNPEPLAAPVKVEPIKIVLEKPIPAPRQEIKKNVGFDTDEALKYIRENDYTFWDMRVWKCRTYEIVMRFLKDFEENLRINKDYLPTNLNSGQGLYFIGKLISNKVPLDTIATNLMLNKHTTFLKRIVECFHKPDACPYWKHYKNFSDCNCERRCNKGEIIGDEHLNTML
jgi:hypothetical protein